MSLCLSVRPFIRLFVRVTNAIWPFPYSKEGNICAKVVGNSNTNYMTEYRAHGSSIRYANELINTQKCHNSTTEVGM